MICKPGRSTSFTNSALAALLLACTAASAHAACDTSVSAVIEPRKLAELHGIIAKLAGKPVGANRAAPEREIFASSSESIPSIVHNILVDPINEGANFWAADLYVGAEYNSKSPDVFGLPRDERALCLLAPTTGVFLSDDVTHHYATVYEVDYKKEVVTLADPWAQVSFLLPGHNLIGVAARARLGAGGVSLLDVTFKDFTRALHGLVNVGALLPPTIDVIDKLYPELAADESYLFWRYARPLTGGMDATIMAMLELSGRDDLKSKPRLGLLSDYTTDLAIGVMSNFQGDKSAGKDAGQANFFRRLSKYATALPWALKWTLLQRSKLRTELPLQLAIVDAFLKAMPADVDFQIERANLLLELHRPADALAQSQTSRRQWERDVASSIAIKPADEAVAAFFARNYGRSQDELFAWRYSRLTLIEAQAALAANPKTPIADKLNDLDSRLGARVRLRVAFLGEMARIAQLTGNRSVSDALIESAADASLAERERAHVANAMYRQFTTAFSVDALSPPTRKKLHTSPLKRVFCDQAEGGEILPDQKKPLIEALAKFCKQKR